MDLYLYERNSCGSWDAWGWGRKGMQSLKRSMSIVHAPFLTPIILHSAVRRSLPACSWMRNCRLSKFLIMALGANFVAWHTRSWFSPRSSESTEVNSLSLQRVSGILAEGEEEQVFGLHAGECSLCETTTLFDLPATATRETGSVLFLSSLYPWSTFLS